LYWQANHLIMALESKYQPSSGGLTDPVKVKVDEAADKIKARTGGVGSGKYRSM